MFHKMHSEGSHGHPHMSGHDCCPPSGHHGGGHHPMHGFKALAYDAMEEVIMKRVEEKLEEKYGKDLDMIADKLVSKIGKKIKYMKEMKKEK